MAAQTVFGRFGVKRVVIVALVAGVLALGLDSVIAHLFPYFFQDGDEPVKVQWVPLFLSPATLVMLLVALATPAGALGRWMLRGSGVLNLVLGLAGTYFHLKSLFSNFHGESFSLVNLGKALAVAPPTFAPGGFAAIGLVAIVVASPRFLLRWEAQPATASAPANGLATDDG